MTGERIDLYSKIISQFPQNSFFQEEQLEKLQTECHYMQDIFRNDVFQLSSERIIRHVDSFVDLYRHTAWWQQIPKDIFFNYVLPYSVDREEISPWPEYFRKAYFSENDSIYMLGNIEDAVFKVHQWLNHRTNGFRNGQNLQYLYFLSPAILDRLLIGSCKELTTRSTAAMRSLGIPVTTDIVPCYTNFKSGHSWNVAVFDSTRFIPFDSSVDTLFNYSNKRLGLSKVYREAFEPQPGSHLAKRGECRFLPEFFNMPFYKDVTNLYVATSDITVPVQYHLNRKIRYGYLAVFTRNGWNPVCWGEINRKVASYKDIGRGGVYIPLSIEADGIRPLNSPFILAETGELKYLEADTTRFQTLKLTRKYPIDERKILFTERMVGGIFQGANKRDFSDAENLYRIDTNPGEYFNTIIVDKKRKYRYIRYLSPPDSYCNVAELEFYDDSVSIEKLKGEIIGTKGVWVNNTKSTKESAFDGDPLTYMDSEAADNIWIGLDFGRETAIEKIRFITRNDMNAVQIGNDYELFYWNNAWISLGRKVASERYLIYEHVPVNALFWLKNHTEGQEERIFTYENDQQVWW